MQRKIFALTVTFFIFLSSTAYAKAIAEGRGIFEKLVKGVEKIFDFFSKIFRNFIRGGFMGQRNVTISGNLKGNKSWLLKGPAHSLFLSYEQPAKPVKFNGQALISEKLKIKLNLSSWKGMIKVSSKPLKVDLDGSVEEWKLAGVGVKGPSKVKTENLSLEELQLKQLEIYSLPIEKVSGKLLIGEQQEISFSRERGIAKIRGFKGNISFMEGFLKLEGRCNSVLVRSGRLRTEITT